MPADCHAEGPIGAVSRLAQRFRAWRQRRAARRARLHSFMGLSDRTLADIGVQRAQVYGALIGAMPLGRDPAPAEESAPEGVVYQLPRPCRLTVVPDDLSTAA